MFFAFCNYSLPIQEDLIKKNKSLRLFSWVKHHQEKDANDFSIPPELSSRASLRERVKKRDCSHLHTTALFEFEFI